MGIDNSLSVLQNQFVDFLKLIGTKKTSLKILKNRFSDILRWLKRKDISINRLLEEQIISEYREEKGINKKRHINTQMGRIKRFLLYSNIIRTDKVLSTDKKGSLRYIMNKYLLYLENSGLKDNTIDSHYYSLLDFIRFTDGAGIYNLSDITKKIVREYSSIVLSGSVKRRSSGSKAIIIGKVKSFFSYAVEEGYLLRSPMDNIVLPKQCKTISRNFLTTEEIQVFFNAIDTSTLMGFVDRCLFELLYGAGLRINEALSLKICDIDFTESMVRIMDTKGGKDRNVPLPECVLKYLNKYINEVRNNLLTRLFVKTDLLFFNYKGRKLKCDWVNHWLRYYAKKAGIKKMLSCHCFRYSYATHMLESGIDMRLLSELMGHSSLDSTARYTKVLVSDLKQELEQHHPRGTRTTGSHDKDQHSITFRMIE